MTKEQLRELADKYGMKGHHFYKDKRGFIIVTRQGVEHIQNRLEIDTYLEPVFEWSAFGDGHFVMKCVASRPMRHGGTVKVTTFGEVSPKNNRNAYPIAMAEKRAVSRAVLKLANLYEEGFFAEDELDTIEKEDS